MQNLIGSHGIDNAKCFVSFVLFYVMMAIKIQHLYVFVCTFNNNCSKFSDASSLSFRFRKTQNIPCTALKFEYFFHLLSIDIVAMHRAAERKLQFDTCRKRKIIGKFKKKFRMIIRMLFTYLLN